MFFFTNNTSKENIRLKYLWINCIILLISLILKFSLWENQEIIIYFFFNKFVFSINKLSIYFILLSNLLIIISIIISWYSIYFLIEQFHRLLLMINIILIILFSSVNLLTFYVCFELVLVPVFLIIVIWGSRKERFKSSYYFFLYTLIGSLFMFISIIWIYKELGNISLCALYCTSLENQNFLILGFFLGLAVKIPMFPIHLWLPQAHTEAPVAGSVLLAGILLKLGGYGFLKFTLPIFNEGSKFITPLIVSLSIVAIVYGAITTIRQTNLKRLIAYSSISHMGLVTIAIFTHSIEGVISSIIIMFAHGLISSGLFIAVTSIYERSHTMIIRIIKISTITPILCSIFFLLSLANMATPCSLNFWGEIIAFNSFFKSSYNIWLLLIACTGVVLSAIYSINLFNSIFFGKSLKGNYYYREVSYREFCVLFLLTLMGWMFGLLITIFTNELMLNSLNLLILS